MTTTSCQRWAAPLRRYCEKPKDMQEDIKGPEKNSSADSNPSTADARKEDKIEATFFTDIELNSSRLGREPLIRLFNSTEFDRASISKSIKEIQHLYEADEQYERQSRENETLNSVQIANFDKLAVLKDHIERKELEFQETLKRLSEQLEKEKLYSVSKLARECLDIIDNVQRCMDAYTAQAKDISDVDKTKGEIFLFDSLSKIHQLINENYEKYGISAMQVKPGDMSDPNFHETVFFVPMPEKEDGQVLHISQKGYTIGERILRPAKIGVIKN